MSAITKIQARSAEQADVAYLFPESVEQAIGYLEEAAGAGRIIAGGTDVLPDIRREKIHPRSLIDITRIPELACIDVSEAYVEIGAAVTFAAIKDSPFLNRHVQALTDAARSVGALAIQNAATWVGNLIQAMPAADGAIIAMALEAEACVVDGQGTEWRPVASLFRGPGMSAIDPTRQLVTRVRFPRPSGSTGTAWRRAGRRPSLVLPIINCGVKLCLDAAGERIERACIALGPVAPTPFRAHDAEEFLHGQPPTKEVLNQAAHLTQQAANPRDSIMRASRAYRLAIIPTLVREALETATQRAQQSRSIM